MPWLWADAITLCHGVCVGEDLWDAYDSMGLSFQQHAADSAYNAHYDRPAVLAALGPVTGRQVLDAACGPGLYAGELLERGAEVTAFDASPVMVSLARQRTADRVRIDRAALGEPLPYPDSAFDLIVCALAIHYAGRRAKELEQQPEEAAVAAAVRILRIMFGSAIPEPDAYRLTRWGQDPFSCGSYSYAPPGATGEDHDLLAAPVGRRLFCAGEATQRRPEDHDVGGLPPTSSCSSAALQRIIPRSCRRPAS